MVCAFRQKYVFLNSHVRNICFVHLIQSFIHSQALIVQDEPLASLFGVS
jgi:hypothetical protein